MPAGLTRMIQENDEGQMLLIDKPYRWTSFDVVKKIKHAGHFAKIGHAGTLDPLATGLLILCTGRLTKQIDTYQAQEKEYTGTLVLGTTTPSADLETAVDQQYPTAHLDEALLRHAARQLTGLLQQVPPMHSAVRVGGERLYQKARRGETVAIQPREVTVSVFELGRIELPEVDFRVVCSKGTYIRSLVRDFGSALRSGAHLTALRRTRIGEHYVSEAFTVEAFVRQASKEP